MNEHFFLEFFRKKKVSLNFEDLLIWKNTDINSVYLRTFNTFCLYLIRASIYIISDLGLYFKKISKIVKEAQQNLEVVVRSCSVKKGVLRNFVKLTVKHLCQSLFFNNFIKKVTLAQVFSCEFCEIFKNTFFHRTPLMEASKNLFPNSKNSTKLRIF